MAVTTDWVYKNDLIIAFGVDDLPVDDNGDVSDEKIDEAINTGITQIEAYLRPVNISIPFSNDIKQELKLYLLDIVRYHYSNALQTATEDITNRYQAALAYLNKVASGKIQLSESGSGKANSLSVMTIIRG